jgi:hypothetical protein
LEFLIYLKQNDEDTSIPLKFIKCLPLEILKVFKEELLKAKRTPELEEGEIQDYFEIAI